MCLRASQRRHAYVLASQIVIDETVLASQIVNGVLLPCVASLLLLSLNDAMLMKGTSQPQSPVANAIMFPCVGITLYLASVVLLKQTVGRMAADGSHVPIVYGFPCAALGILGLLWRVRILRGSHHMCYGRRAQATPEITLSMPPC